MSRSRVPVLAAAMSLIGLLQTVIWGLTDRFHYFWPGWFWVATVLVVAIATAFDYAWRAATLKRRLFRLNAGLTATLWGLLSVIWVLTHHHHHRFWPAYPIAVFGFLLGMHALVVFGDRLAGGDRRQLSERVDVLTRSREGALNVQDAQLRRIERDLHDGAQARLVALTMQLGRAEDQLERASEQGTQAPDLRPMLRDARAEAQAAISELRELARGIAPPLLADRGLQAAVEALAQRSAVSVEFDSALARRLPAVIENAAYFIAAESLTNAAKHAGGAAVTLSMREQNRSLVIDVSDSGPGGADESGNGLTGLRQRVEALDGTITVHSAHGHGTWIHVELPCGS